MKKPMLVGLNDTNLQQNSLIQNLQTCFATLSPETTPLSYKNLFAGDNSNNEKAISTASIWAGLLGLNSTKKDNHESKENYRLKHGQYSIPLDLKNYIYTRYNAVPLFTDDFGNRILVRVNDNPLHIQSFERGCYGGKNLNNAAPLGNGWFETSDFITRKLGHNFSGGGWFEEFIKHYTFWNDYNSVSLLENVGIGKRKLNKPVLLEVDRDAGISFDSWEQYIGTAVGVILQFIPAIGTATGAAIIAAVNIGVNYIKNPAYKLTSNDLKALSENLSPVLFTEGGADLKPYLNQAQNLYQAIENNDYATISNTLGIGRAQATQLSNQLFTPNLLDTIQRANGGKNFKQNNAYLQHLRNLALNDELIDASQALATGRVEQNNLVGLVDLNHSLSSGQEMFNLMVMNSGGGYTSALATNAGDTDPLNWIFDKLNISEKTPEVHKTFWEMQAGIPTGTNAFDTLLLENIERQIVKEKLRSFTIPAQLPPSKADCIRKELSKYGVSVLSPEYGKKTATKENILTTKRFRVLRNFK